MPSFEHNLVGIGSFCDTYFTVTFDKDAVTIADPAGRLIITGWREPEGTRMWLIALIHNEDLYQPIVPGEELEQAPVDAFIVYGLPSAKSLILCCY